MKQYPLTRTIRPLLFALCCAVLAGCGTTAINQQAMQAYHDQISHHRTVAQAHASQCSAAANGCEPGDGLCRVAVILACGQTQPSHHIQQPQLRSPGEEFARGFAPVAQLASTGLQLWGAGYLVDRSGRNAVDLVGAVGNVAGQIQGPIDNSVNVAGNYGDTHTRGDETVVGGNWGDTRGDETHVGGNFGDTRTVNTRRDTIGGDRGGDTGRDRYAAGRDIRQESPGPIDTGDCRAGADCSTVTPAPLPDPPPDPDPGG